MSTRARLLLAAAAILTALGAAVVVLAGPPFPLDALILLLLGLGSGAAARRAWTWLVAVAAFGVGYALAGPIQCTQGLADDFERGAYSFLECSRVVGDDFVAVDEEIPWGPMAAGVGAGLAGAVGATVALRLATGRRRPPNAVNPTRRTPPAAGGPPEATTATDASDAASAAPAPDDAAQVAAQVKYCSNCGTPGELDARFCQTCGHPFK